MSDFYKNHGQNFIDLGTSSFVCTKLLRASDAILLDNETIKEVFQLSKIERFADGSLAREETPRLVFYLGQTACYAGLSDTSIAARNPYSYEGFVTVSTRYLQNELVLRNNEHEVDNFVNLYMGEFILDKDGIVLSHQADAVDPRALWVLREHFGLEIADLIGRINCSPLSLKALQEQLQKQMHAYLLSRKPLESAASL